MQITFVTGNLNKLHSARAILSPLGYEVTQRTFDIQEIQDETGDEIARDKAQKAFALAGTPVVITDDTWHIPALNGFPGPYMKSINTWFTADDFLRLTLPLEDRTVILRQHLVYQDETTQQLFVSDTLGTLQTETRGHAPKEPCATIISFQDDGKTMAEMWNEDLSPLTKHRNAWHMLAEWLEQNPTS